MNFLLLLTLNLNPTRVSPWQTCFWFQPLFKIPPTSKSKTQFNHFVLNTWNVLRVAPVRVIFCCFFVLFYQPHRPLIFSLSFPQTPFGSPSAFLSSHKCNGKNWAVYTALTDKSRQGGWFSGTQAQRHWGICLCIYTCRQALLLFSLGFFKHSFISIFSAKALFEVHHSYAPANFLLACHFKGILLDQICLLFKHSYKLISQMASCCTLEGLF